MGRGAKGGDDLWTYEPIPFDSFSSFLHPFRSPKALQAATKAIPATSVVLPAAFEALPAASKAFSAISEAFAATNKDDMCGALSVWEKTPQCAVVLIVDYKEIIVFWAIRGPSRGCY